VVPLFSPRAGEWSAHFRWSSGDSCVLQPLTPEGRATAALLELNSLERIAIRRWLTVVGMHPPV
jgi:hypothetical protein